MFILAISRVIQSGARLFPLNNFVHRNHRLLVVGGNLVHNEFTFHKDGTRMSGGNEYAWEGKGPGFESDQNLIF